MSDATQQALLPIFLTWGLPFGVSLAAVSYSLSCTGWSTLRLEAILATSKLSDVRYTQIAPAAVFVYRITCLSPLTFLVLLGVDIIRKFQGSTTLGACILLVGPSLLLLGWAWLRSRFCKWHVSWWVLVAATVGAAGLLAAQLAFAIVPSTPFLSFSAVFLGLSAMPIVFISELGIEPGRAPLLLSLRAVSDKEAALVPTDWQRWVSTGFAAYMIITAAYVGVGAMRQDVAPMLRALPPRACSSLTCWRWRCISRAPFVGRGVWCSCALSNVSCLWRSVPTISTKARRSSSC